LKTGDIIIGKGSAHRYGVTKDKTTWIYVCSEGHGRSIGMFGMGAVCDMLEPHLDACRIFQRYIQQHYKEWNQILEFEYAKKVNRLRTFFPKDIIPETIEFYGFNYFEVDAIDFEIFEPITLSNGSLALQHLKKLGDEYEIR